MITKETEQKLLSILSSSITDDDPSHDLQHTLRVVANAKNIAASEGADLDVVIPAAIFHDLVTYPKNDPKNKFSVAESAEKAGEILSGLDEYPTDKIERVRQAIKCTSFSFGQTPTTIEDKVVKDSDMLEATGAIAIMRTFASSGKMGRAFYEPSDPFASNRQLDDLKYSMDLFYTRLLNITDRLSTESARVIAKRRNQFLMQFIEELKVEIEGR